MAPSTHMTVNGQPELIKTFLTEGEQITLHREILNCFSHCFHIIDTSDKSMRMIHLAKMGYIN